MSTPPLSLVMPGARPVLPVVASVPVPSRVRVLPWTRLEMEQARQFLMELDGRVAGADLPRMAYLMGLLEGHAQTLLDFLDAITEVS